MRLFRYRRPSLNALLSTTKAKKRLKKELGITDALKPLRAWTNAKRRFINNELEPGREPALDGRAGCDQRRAAG